MKKRGNAFKIRFAENLVTCAAIYLLDSKPAPVLGYKRRKGRSDFAGIANDGHCASRNLDYVGFKLVTISTLDGIPVVYDLVQANLDERLPLKA